MQQIDFRSLGYSDIESDMLSAVSKAITEAGAWEWLRTFSGESFMFSNDPEITKITENLADVDENGRYFGWIMRELEVIAKKTDSIVYNK